MTHPTHRLPRLPVPGIAFGLVVGLFALLGSACTVAGQVFGGPIVPSGHLRIDMNPTFVSWQERFGLRTEGGSTVEEVEPLGWVLTSNAFGDDRLSGPLEGQDILRTLLADPAYRHSLGRSEHYLEAHVRRVPLSIDLGITSWLTIGATVPFVQRRIDAELIYDAEGANAGPVPSLAASGPFLNEYQLAIAQTGVALDTLCASVGDTAPECTDGRAFLLDAASLFQSLDALYTLSSFMPLTGSSAADSVGRQIDDVRSGMSGYGVDSFTAPAPFSDPLDQAGFESAVLGPGANGGLPLEGVGSLWELGDVEVHAAIRLIDTTRRRGLPPRVEADSSVGESPQNGSGGGLGFRLGVAGLVRLATAMTQDSVMDFLDLDVTEGQMDMEARAFGDILLGNRLGLRFDGRYGIASPATIRRRIAGPDALLASDVLVAPVEWTPGNYLDIAVAPELFLTSQLALGFVYRHFTRGEATYDGSATGVNVAPLILETDATVQSMGLEVRYSSLPARARGETGLPIEVRFGWESARSGTGGRTPKTGRVRLGLSLFRRLWGAS